MSVSKVCLTAAHQSIKINFKVGNREEEDKKRKEVKNIKNKDFVLCLTEDIKCESLKNPEIIKRCI